MSDLKLGSYKRCLFLGLKNRVFSVRWGHLQWEHVGLCSKATWSLFLQRGWFQIGRGLLKELFQFQSEARVQKQLAENSVQLLI